jgi:hypothetical protein
MTHDPVTEMSPAQRAAVAAAADAFGVDLYRRLGADGQDLVFSPASIAAALQLALLGARGSTASQLAAALHLGHPSDPAGAAEEGLRLLSSLIQAANAHPDSSASPGTGASPGTSASPAGSRPACPWSPASPARCGTRPRPRCSRPTSAAPRSRPGRPSTT